MATGSKPAKPFKRREADRTLNHARLSIKGRDSCDSVHVLTLHLTLRINPSCPEGNSYNNFIRPRSKLIPFYVCLAFLARPAPARYHSGDLITRKPKMTDLKLLALDAEDLAVLSAHLQDAVVRAADMTFDKAGRRFVAVANRFDWAGNADSDGDALTRKRCGIRIERVQSAQVAGFKPGSDAVLSLLAFGFEETNAPGGLLTLTFSGNAAIRLKVECIEGQLKDLGAAWETQSKPRHEDDPAGGAA